MLAPLEKFLMLMQKTGRMPIKSAIKKTGQQIGKVGTAMAENPRAAVGGGLLGGAATGYAMAEEDPEEEKKRLLMQYLMQAEQEQQGPENVY